MRNRAVLSLYAGVFLTSFSAIVFEISLTRIFSVTLWYHFAYFVVSLALFGLGAGGLAAFGWRSFFAARFPRILKHLASLQFLSMVGCLVLVLAVPHQESVTGRLFLILTGLYVACAVPFVFVGLILSLVIRHHAENVPRIYLCDLVGAASGCIGFVLAITFVSGPSVVLIAGMLSLAASILLSERGKWAGLGWRIAVAAVLAVGLSIVSEATPVFSIRHTKNFAEREDLLLERWSPMSRTSVYPKVIWAHTPEDPFGWGLGWNFVTDQRAEQLWIQQDGSAGTPVTRFTGDFSELEYLKYDITSFVYYVPRSVASVFILGSGGGRDVLAARAFGVPVIDACDINPVTIDLVRNEFREFSGGVYELPGVTVTVAEGRNTLRRERKAYDVIQLPLTDTWAATVAGAFSLAENGLYTVEAFSGYLDRLSENGILSVTRFLFKRRNQSVRVALVARGALELRGVEHPEDNIAVVATGAASGVATVLVKKTAFTPTEIRRIHRAAEAVGFEVLYVPGAGRDPAFVRALTTKPLEAFLADVYYDLRPSTDDRPFFFQMIYFSRALDLLRGGDIRGQIENYYAPLVLMMLLALSSVLVLLFYVLPLMLSRRAEPLPATWGLYFVLIGIAFMFVEIPLIQRGSLYLGHPTYGLTIVLFSMLTFAGIGSFWSGRMAQPTLAAAARRWLLTAALLVAIAVVLSGLLIRYAIGLPFPARVVLYVLAAGVPAFFMGTAFPTGIRLASRLNMNSIPWIWALNGGASVTGSVLAMAVAMAFGYTLALMLGAVAYLLAFLTVLKLK